MKPVKKHTLSKSSFIRGLQCSKSLYLYKYFYGLRDKLSPETLSKFSRGHSVGLLAQQLFPDGINLKPFSHQQYANSAERTKENILNGANTIYEAAFSHNDVTVFLDILHFEDGHWHAYEVKSSAEVSETFIMDASLQYYVIENSGIDLASFEIIYLNKDYVRHEHLDIKKLFCFHDVLQDIKNNLQFIQTKVEEFKMLLSNKEVPGINIGKHCSYPYTCDFIGHCWKDIPKRNTIFSIPSFNDEEKFSLFNKGETLLEEISLTAELDEMQKIQINFCIRNEEYFNVEELREYFSVIKYPVLTSEMLSYRAAVPQRKNTRPYQPVPFLFHAALINEKGKEIKSYSLFQEDVSNRTVDFYKNITDVINETESIIVFNIDYFQKSIQTLASDGSLNQSQMEVIENKTKDLASVFYRNFYFNPLLSGNHDLQNIARGIFKMRISRNMISSYMIASDMYDTLQSETDMFHIVEIKEKLNEYAGFNLEVIRKLYSYLLSKTLV